MESPQEPPSACVKDKPYHEGSDWVAELEAELGQELQPPVKDEPVTEKPVARCLVLFKLPERH